MPFRAVIGAAVRLEVVAHHLPGRGLAGHRERAGHHRRPPVAKRRRVFQQPLGEVGQGPQEQAGDLSARGEGQCVVEDGVQIAPRARLLPLSPASVRPSCPVAAGLIAWQTQVVQPAALGILGVWVQRIEHLGSYSCRRLYGRADAGWSEHATADAIDISGFVLSDGTRISVLKDWDDEGDKGAFLRAVRDGGCRVFSTVLSPDYNAAHADHLHMDQAARGATGWRSCR
ncbi:MAG: hypothetical protein B7Z12_20785 [Caulobacter vibrioides]|uniref:Extensin-like C-terminal domain-containing protein n=1 Tax=Caulobacter vibrioides TaxID=155892 RepID=A0A258CR03_CAUVI|nr:MAG: hypothetical protein B7Z12_20785 [Caulobacter vibrioides]